MASSYCVLRDVTNCESSDQLGKLTHVSFRTSWHSAVRPLQLGCTKFLGRAQ
jgi:hypothetical protein